MRFNAPKFSSARILHYTVKALVLSLQCYVHFASGLVVAMLQSIYPYMEESDAEWIISLFLSLPAIHVFLNVNFVCSSVQYKIVIKQNTSCLTFNYSTLFNC